MKIKLSFAAYFSSIIGEDCIELELSEGTRVSDAIDILLKDNPDYYRKLNERKLFLLGDFRAIYHINRMVVKKDHVLKDGDNLNILKAFIGG